MIHYFVPIYFLSLYFSVTDEKMFRPQFYLVFEYCDHDLAGLTQRVQFANPVRKQIMLQLLNGIFYLHR